MLYTIDRLINAKSFSLAWNMHMLGQRAVWQATAPLNDPATTTRLVVSILPPVLGTNAWYESLLGLLLQCVCVTEGAGVGSFEAYSTYK